MISSQVIIFLSDQTLSVRMSGGRAGLEGWLWMSDTTRDHEKKQNLFLCELDGAWIAGKGFNLFLGHV